MKTYVLDASALLAAFEPSSDQHEPAASLLASGRTNLATLDLARYEMANAAACGWRSPDHVADVLEALEQIAEDGGLIASSNALLAHAARIATEESLSVYDAAYVAATRRGDRRLVSCDIRDLVSKGLAMTPAEALAGNRN